MQYQDGQHIKILIVVNLREKFSLGSGFKPVSAVLNTDALSDCATQTSHFLLVDFHYPPDWN